MDLERLAAYGVDIPQTLWRFRENEVLYEKLLRCFVAEPGFTDLQKAVLQHEYMESFKIAHTMKGVAANLGLTPLYDALNAFVKTVRGGTAEYPLLVAQMEQVTDCYHAFCDLMQELSSE